MRRTEETVPGHRFDLHSAAHNIINMTVIPRQLDLAGAGLVYQEMDPFSVAVFADGRRVRFHRSVEATVYSVLIKNDSGIFGRSPRGARIRPGFADISVVRPGSRYDGSTPHNVPGHHLGEGARAIDADALRVLAQMATARQANERF